MHFTEWKNRKIEAINRNEVLETWESDYLGYRDGRYIPSNVKIFISQQQENDFKFQILIDHKSTEGNNGQAPSLKDAMEQSLVLFVKNFLK